MVADHFSGNPATQAFFANFYISWFLMLAFVLALSLTSFYLLELPIVNLKKWFDYTRLAPQKPEVVPVGLPVNGMRPLNEIQPSFDLQT
jgi:hypothetical protein